MRKRTQAREYALQILYQKDITQDPIGMILDRFRQNQKCDPDIHGFMTELTEGISENLDMLDALISEYSEHWELDRMAIIDRDILRLAAYEMLYRDDIPPKVTINEAVELAHKYSTPDSSKFINGILDKIMTRSRVHLTDSK